MTETDVLICCPRCDRPMTEDEADAMRHRWERLILDAAALLPWAECHALFERARELLEGRLSVDAPPPAVQLRLIKGERRARPKERRNPQDREDPQPA